MFNLLKRDVLIGLGTGFIISGIMVSTLGIGQPTDEQIKERAAKLGMVETIASLKGQSQPLQQEQSKPFQQEQSKPLQQEQSKPAPPEKPNDSVSTESVKTYKEITFVIKPGMGSETIAELLEEREVVKDRNQFYKLVSAHKAHSSFRSGRFELPVGGDMEEILKILTGK